MNIKEQKEILQEKIKELEKRESINIKSEGKTYFYCFKQNNSGGMFDENDNVCENVIIEAHTPEEANKLADNVGIYFDGCSTGQDCSCCGDRWYELWEDAEGTDIPTIYGKDVNEIYKSCFSNKVIIHYLDGTKKKIIFKTYQDCPKHDFEEDRFFCNYNLAKCKICGMYKSELNKENKK